MPCSRTGWARVYRYASFHPLSPPLYRYLLHPPLVGLYWTLFFSPLIRLKHPYNYDLSRLLPRSFCSFSPRAFPYPAIGYLGPSVMIPHAFHIIPYFRLIIDRPFYVIVYTFLMM